MIRREAKYELSTESRPFLSSVSGRINILLELVKIRITVLVSFTTALGYVLASPGPGFGILYPVIGIFLLACGSAALNQYQESGTDILMERTARRPIPSGRISRNSVLWIVVALLSAGSLILILKTNLYTLLTGLLTFYWYNGVYTPLKKKTPLAIIPGSLVGALPPVAGWFAGGGILTDARILIVSVYFFVWQIPHFWLLLLLYSEDFKKGGFPVLTERYTRDFIRKITFMLLTVTLIIASAMPFFGIGQFLFSKILIMCFSVLMMILSYRFFKDYEITRKGTVRTFISINLYTLIIITILSADKLFSLI